MYRRPQCLVYRMLECAKALNVIHVRISDLFFDEVMTLRFNRRENRRDEEECSDKLLEGCTQTSEHRLQICSP